MPSNALTVVISAGQSRNPEKRSLEEGIASEAAKVPGVQVLRIPHLYDVAPGGESFTALKSIEGDMVVLCWLFDRATHWTLDRNGVRGQVGQVELVAELDEEEEIENELQDEEERVVFSQPRPERNIFCIDFRVSNDVADYLAEIQRIVKISVQQTATPLTLEMLQRYDTPTNDTFVGSSGDSLGAPLGGGAKQASAAATLFGTSSLAVIEEHPARRWYPVIDFSRCTNCMECIDFCLFGVYGVDTLETIVVEQADNCRKGCPACSRVCPQNAIMFPQHKTPAIAGAPVDASGMKIDLSKLFGAPESDEDAAAVAARERDEQLILAGRAAVGVADGLNQRIANSKASHQADALDGLIDELDSLDL